jgi:hypothetical protein
LHRELGRLQGEGKGTVVQEAGEVKGKGKRGCIGHLSGVLPANLRTNIKSQDV